MHRDTGQSFRRLLTFLSQPPVHRMKTLWILIGFAAAELFVNIPMAMAASFTVGSGVTDTTAKTLGSGSGQTGAVASTGTLSVSGTTVAVTISGNNATLTNNGTISQTGSGRVIRDNTGVTGLIVTNNAGALMQAADADVIQMNKSPASVTLNNYGTMISLNASAGGSQVVDFTAIASGSNVINNYSTGIMQAFEADAVRPGVNGVVYNAGTIKSTTSNGSSSDGIDVQSNTGVQITNDTTGLVEGGRHGITGGAPDNTVTFTTAVTNKVGGVIKGDNGSGINLDGLGAKQSATIINAGTITGNGHDIGDGLSHDGDGIDVDGLVTITNTGTIRSINAFSPASSGLAYSEGITVGGGTITNSGIIEGLVSSGNTNAVGRGISLLGNDITTGPLAGTREAIYGNATVTNQAGGLIRGQSDSGIYVDGPASGFTVTIDNQAGAMIQGGGTANAAIKTGADNDTITNAGTIDGASSGKAIDLGGGNDQLTVTGGSAVINGSIDGGSGSNKLTFNLGAANKAFTHSDVISNFDKVDVLSGLVTLNGNNTYSGATTVGGGLAAASLRVNGRHSGGGAYTVLSGNTLGGTGVFALAGPSTSIDIQNGATLHIGGGRLTVETGSLNVAGVFSFDLNGTTAGTAGGYDQLLFSAGNTGTLSLTGASTLLLNLGFTPVVGQQFELIDVQNSSTFINGAFAGLSEGAIFNVGSDEFQISYRGGTGNDLVVTAIPEPATTAIIAGIGVLMYTLLRRRRAAIA
jgi:hypothetical protein